MSQHDYVISDQDGASFLVDLLALTSAIVTQNAGDTAPSTTYPHMFWVDTSANKIKQRNEANDAWVEIGDLDSVGWGKLARSGGAMSGVLQLDAGADIASGATVDLGNATGNDITITHSSGTTAITSFGGATDIQKGTRIRCRFNISGGSLSITYNATSMKIQGLGNLTLVDGMSLDVVKISDSNAYWAIENITSPSDTSLTVGAIDVQQFRLTLTSGQPVTSSDVTGATTIYCTPYRGNKIALYDGTKWVVRASAEFSLALGTLTSGRPYDVFCYDNAGVPTLEFTSWTNATTRATALTYQDGILVKTGALTRRYLGTFYTTSTTQTADSAANRLLVNYYNSVDRPLMNSFTANRTTTSTSYAEINSEIRVQFLTLLQNPVLINANGAKSVNSGSGLISTSIGFDGATAENAFNAIINPTGGNDSPFGLSLVKGGLAEGFHYATLLGKVSTGTGTWQGSGTAGTRTAINGYVKG